VVVMLAAIFGSFVVTMVAVVVIGKRKALPA
jgi:hypothetical protein